MARSATLTDAYLFGEAGLFSARRNAGDGADDYDIGADGAPVRAFVIAAREDKQIAGEVRSVLAR